MWFDEIRQIREIISLKYALVSITILLHPSLPPSRTLIQRVYNRLMNNEHVTKPRGGVVEIVSLELNITVSNSRLITQRNVNISRIITRNGQPASKCV